MGEVYAARPADAEEDDLVAIKTIRTKEYTGAERDMALVGELRKRIIHQHLHGQQIVLDSS